MTQTFSHSAFRLFGWMTFLLCFTLCFTACSSDNDEEDPTGSGSQEETTTVPVKIDIYANVTSYTLEMSSSTEIVFRVFPTGASFNYDLTSASCQLALKRADNTTPTSYALTGVAKATDADGKVIAGRYRATLADLGTGTTYSETARLTLTVKNSVGSDVLLQSPTFTVSCSGMGAPATGLPVVVINTPNGVAITSKEVWTEGTEMRIYDVEDGAYKLDYEGTLSMKGRGNTTWWNYPKKPYALKLDSKSKILGMKKHKRWCLIANWLDRTLMRNAVSYEAARRLSGMAWTPEGKYVELVLNGVHQGNYWLCEQIKVDGNRVDITELDEKATSGDAITGGYVFELDYYYDEPCKFKSLIYKLPWQFKDPDEVNSAQMSYVQSYVAEMERTLSDDTRFANREFTNYLDLDSFVDYWFVYELSQNWEPNWPKSVYMNKDVDSKDGRLKAGPVWDFDWGTYVPQSTYSYTIHDAVYYGRLFQDAQFRQLVKTRWEAQKAQLRAVGESYIDSLKEELAASDVYNHAMWPITGGSLGDENLSYTDAVARLKKAYLGKWDWLDKEISNY